MAEQTAEGPRIQFRVGINIGDIIIDGDDIFGDDVNLAARVENECAPGGCGRGKAAGAGAQDHRQLMGAEHDLCAQATGAPSRYRDVASEATAPKCFEALGLEGTIGLPADFNYGALAAIVFKGKQLPENVAMAESCSLLKDMSATLT
jgi:hypothetical protein